MTEDFLPQKLYVSGNEISFAGFNGEFNRVNKSFIWRQEAHYFFSILIRPAEIAYDMLLGRWVLRCGDARDVVVQSSDKTSDEVVVPTGRWPSGVTVNDHKEIFADFIRNYYLFIFAVIILMALFPGWIPYMLIGFVACCFLN